MNNPKYIILGGMLLLYLGIAGCNGFQNEQNVAYTQYLTNGHTLYTQHCANCHGNNGEGLQKLYPPLTDTLFLRKNKHKLACMIKFGIENDSIQIHQQWYHAQMPQNETLQTIDIAQIIVYITNNFGNTQGAYSYQEVQQDITQCMTNTKE